MSDEQDDSGLGMDDPSVPEPLAPLPPVNNDEDLIQVDDEPDGEINDHDVDVVLGEIEEGDVPCDPCAVTLVHPDEVYAVSSHLPFIATGCKDEKGRIWDMRNPDAPVFSSSHQETVTSVGFSTDGQLVAFGPLTGPLKVFRKPSWQDEDNEFPGIGESIQFLNWHPSSQTLLYGCEESDSAAIQPLGRPPIFCYGQGEPETGCFELPHGKRAFIAFKSCEVVGVDGTNGIQMQKVRTRSPVISMFASNDLLALGLENGVVQVRLCGDKDLKVVFESEPARRDGVGGGGNEDDESAFVEAVTIFSSPSGGPLVVSACGSGGLTAWDVPRSTARWSLNMEAGATRIVTSDSGGVSQLYIGCTDGKVLLVGGITGVVEKTIQAHEYGTPITDLRKDGSYLITAGMDGTVKLWSLPL